MTKKRKAVPHNSLVADDPRKPLWARAAAHAMVSSTISHMGVSDLEGWFQVQSHPLISWLLREKGSKASQFQILPSFKEYIIFISVFVYEYSIPTASPLLPRSMEERVTMTQGGDSALALVEAPQQSSEVIHGPLIQFRAATRCQTTRRRSHMK